VCARRVRSHRARDNLLESRIQGRSLRLQIVEQCDPFVPGRVGRALINE
jgi:hypothetical protein